METALLPNEMWKKMPEGEEQKWRDGSIIDVVLQSIEVGEARDGIGHESHERMLVIQEAEQMNSQPGRTRRPNDGSYLTLPCLFPALSVMDATSFATVLFDPSDACSGLSSRYARY